MSEVTFDFGGKNFVVVGASSGIGRQIAVELAEAGANVLAVARNEERLKELSINNDSIRYEILDVLTATADDWKRIIGGYTEKNGKLDGVVYTAGISELTTLQAFDEEKMRRIVSTSFDGAIKALHICTKKRYANANSSFVLFSSVAAHTAEKGLFAYSAAKAAVVAAVKTLSHDLSRYGERINTISPGTVLTRMTVDYEDKNGQPLQVHDRHLLGVGKPSDISGMVLFLLSDRARWITGQDFVIDGGYMCGAFN